MVTTLIALVTIPYQLKKEKNNSTKDGLSTDETLIDAYDRMKSKFLHLIEKVEQLEVLNHQLRKEIQRLKEMTDLTEELDDSNKNKQL